MADETLPSVPAEESDDDAFSARIANNLFREPSAEDQVREAFVAFNDIKNARKRAFLVAISFLYEVVPASAACGISRESHYRWLRDKDDPETKQYEEAFARARQMVGQRAVSAVIQRGLFGWDEPVYYEGQLVGWTRKRNDRFAEKVAGWHMPELVKDRTETTHKGSIRAMAAPPWMAYLTDEELERLSVQSEELRKLAEARMNPEAKALPEKSA